MRLEPLYVYGLENFLESAFHVQNRTEIPSRRVETVGVLVKRNSSSGGLAMHLPEPSAPIASPESALGVLEAERFERGILITFSSGEAAFYSTDLLYRTLSHARRIDSPSMKE